MNSLVADMLLAQNREDLELRNLEGLLEDDCKCGSSHERAENTCSIEVVGRKSVECSGRVFNICQNSWNYNAQYLAEGGWACPRCGNDLEDCWTIRPI